MPSSVDQKTGVVSRVFNYRCFVNRQFEEPLKVDTVTKQYHIELTENNGDKIVEDRATDWVELAQKDVPNVGIANVIRLAEKGLIDQQKLIYSDDEALDLSDMNPMDPQSIKNTISSGETASARLEGIAKQLNCSVDDLVASLMNGTFADLVNKQTEKKEGEE